MISDLPAVKEATAPHGIFSVAARKPFMHPNLGLAQSILKDGIVPFDKVPFLQLARALSTHEYQSHQFAQDQITGRTIHNFERVFVIDTEGDFVLTFGSYLVIDEDTLTNPHYAKVLAHELAHLNNGDSYVKAALWFLGKGWMQEFMSPFGVIQEPIEEQVKRIHQDAHDVTFTALRGGWRMGLLATGVVVARNAFSGVGSGVRSLEPQITKYFHDWDVKADALAEQWIGVLEYQAFLRDLDQVIGRRPFDASARVRQLASEERMNTPIVQPVASIPARPRSAPHSSKKYMLSEIVVGIFVLGIACLVGISLLLLILASISP